MSKNKINVILDLDQTLISSELLEEYDYELNEKKLKKFNSHNMDNYYIVFERPGLQKFLDYIFDNFNVSIWTAASKDYALFIIEKIILSNKTNRQLDWVFFSYHCTLAKKLSLGSKKISILWDNFNLNNYNDKNTIIIDDYDEVYNIQPGNCIIAWPFEYTADNSENDNFFNLLIENLKYIKIKKNPADIINQKLINKN